MGIPAYFSHIVKQHSNTLKKFNVHSFPIDNLLLDSNSIIYDCVYTLQKTTPELCTVSTTKYENVLIKAVCDKIKYYINTIKPSNTVYISFDGVAPVAKLEQQRNRRYKSQFTNNINSYILNNHINHWDTTNITPGTKFMINLSKQIHSYFQHSNEFNVLNILISTSLIHGEGEHKLFENIRNDNNYMNQTTVIYGLDADLIMLSLNHIQYCHKIYLFRETPEFIKHIDSSLNPNELYVLDINNMATNLVNELNNNEPIEHDYQMHRIHDYIFICFMLGNDFIPHIPCINIRTNGITQLLDAYKLTVAKHKENITNGCKINWSVFRKFIKYLTNNETSFYKLEYDIRFKQSKRFFASTTPKDKLVKFTNIPIQNREQEIYINPGEEYWQSRYYKTLFCIDKTDHNVGKICTNYLEALEWTFKYYSIGCSDWRWSYHYNYPPLMEDLIKYIPHFDTDFISNVVNPNPVEDIVQLSYVLPKKSLNLLPPEKLEILMQHIPTYYSDNCEFQWSFCKYFWESHINMPHINLEKLEQLLLL